MTTTPPPAGFTPGPWTEKLGDIGHTSERHGGFCALAMVMGRAKNEANARLIAAAPDLYAACRDVVNCHDNLGDDALAQAVSMARAALARAGGGA